MLFILSPVVATASFCLLLWPRTVSTTIPALVQRDPMSACSQIEASVSPASEVYWPGSPNYLEDIAHFSSSSTQESTCSVEPGTSEDVATILRILGSTNTSFAVKGGGHASNPTFSSTTGVQISLVRFSEITFHESSSTVDVGAGLIWDDVYYALEPYGANVVGGRVSGIGVAGFTLGGGYSFLTNQYGLTVDTVTGFQVVLPTGTVLNVTQSSNPDLMFALKGGYNNFGIVTRFTLQTFPQPEVWGGLIIYGSTSMPAVSSAIANYSAHVTDPKAALLAAYNYDDGQVIASLTLFYDGSSPPEGIFDEFLAVPSLSENVSSRSWISLFLVNPSNLTANTRGIFNTISVLEYTDELLDVVLNETQFWGSYLSLQSAVLVSYDIEPFLPTLFSHGSTVESAYPPSRAQPFLPLNIYYAWASSANDATFYSAAEQSAAYMKAQAVSMGQNVEDAFVYGNYAIFTTPVEDIFGAQLPKLLAIKEAVDPRNVMGLTGGWKV